MSEQFARGFFRVLGTLKDYLPDIVVGGGWAPFLYYRYMVGNKEHQTVFTRDIDLMVGTRLPEIGSRTVDQLLVEAGMKARFKSRDIPPLIHYEGKIEGLEIEIEFLTDQTGSRPDLVVEVQKGLHAEALRYISILVENAMELNINDVELCGADTPIIVRVPTPAAFIFQKGLAFPRRRDKIKAAKDLYYIFDILAGTPEIRDKIDADFAVFLETHPKWLRTFSRNLKKRFESTDAESAYQVVEQRPAGAFSKLDDDQLRQYVYATMDKFLKKLMR